MIACVAEKRFDEGIEVAKQFVGRFPNKQLAELAQWGSDAAIISIERSITNGWQGLFEPRDAPKTERKVAELVLPERR